MNNRYMIKEKMWSLGNNFKIADENGEDAFFVKGKVFSWGDDLSLLDTAGVEQARIKQKLMSFLPIGVNLSYFLA